MSTELVRVAKATLFLILFGVLSSLCLACDWHRPCKVPDRLGKQDVVGEWQLTYGPDYYVSDPIEGTLVVTGTTVYLIRPDSERLPLTDCGWLLGFYGEISRHDVAWERCPQLRNEDHVMDGRETLILREDGTFQQTFHSNEYSYEGPIQKWEYISEESAPDGPKMRMHGMKYFAEGVIQANSTVSITLKAQVVDLLRIQDYVESNHPHSGEVSGGVVYPDWGHVYLYPRLCQGELSLLQMGFRVGDPDNLVVRSPVFQRR